MHSEEEWYEQRYGGHWERSPINPEIMVTVTQPSDPAYVLLSTGPATTPTTYSKTCYICNDPEFAQMGLPLCYTCEDCGEHVAADEVVCVCGWDAQKAYQKKKG